jgi:hypothetical protein
MFADKDRAYPTEAPFDFVFVDEEKITFLILSFRLKHHLI